MDNPGIKPDEDPDSLEGSEEIRRDDLRYPGASQKSGTNVELARTLIAENRERRLVTDAVTAIEKRTVGNVDRERRGEELQTFLEGLARGIEGVDKEFTREAQIYENWIAGEMTLGDAVTELMRKRKDRKDRSKTALQVDGFGRVEGLLPLKAQDIEMTAYKGGKNYDKISERAHPGYIDAITFVISRAMQAVDAAIEVPLVRDSGKIILDGRVSKVGKKMRGVEIGAGTGLAALAIARHLQNSLNLAAVEVDKEVFEILRRNVNESGFSNVKPLRGDGEYVKFPDKGIDLAFMVFSLHHFGPIKAIQALKNIKMGMEIALEDDPEWEPELYIIEECPKAMAPKNARKARQALLDMHGMFVSHIWGAQYDSETIGDLQEAEAADAVVEDEKDSLKEGLFWIDIIKKLLKGMNQEDYWPSTIQDWLSVEATLKQMDMLPLPDSGELKLPEYTIQTLLDLVGFEIPERKNMTKEVVGMDKGGVMAFRCRLKGAEQRKAARKAKLKKSTPEEAS